MTTTATISAVDEAAQMIRHWTHGDVLGSLSVTEGYILADLFEQLDHPDTADHIVRLRARSRNATWILRSIL